MAATPSSRTIGSQGGPSPMRRPRKQRTWRRGAIPSPLCKRETWRSLTSTRASPGRSPAQMVRGYRMLTEVQKSAPGDVGVLKGIGRALLLGKEPLEALKAFEQVLQLDPDNSAAAKRMWASPVWSPARWKSRAAHLERALSWIRSSYRRRRHSGRSTESRATPKGRRPAGSNATHNAGLADEMKSVANYSRRPPDQTVTGPKLSMSSSINVLVL